jgi:hypothetical protein
MWCLFDDAGACIRRASEYGALKEWCEKRNMPNPRIEWVKGQPLGKLKSAGPPSCPKCEDRGWVLVMAQVAPAAYRWGSAKLAEVEAKCRAVPGFDQEFSSVENSNLLAPDGLTQWVVDWAWSHGLIAGEWAEVRQRCNCPKANHHRRVGADDAAPF